MYNFVWQPNAKLFSRDTVDCVVRSAQQSDRTVLLFLPGCWIPLRISDSVGIARTCTQRASSLVTVGVDLLPETAYMLSVYTDIEPIVTVATNDPMINNLQFYGWRVTRVPSAIATVETATQPVLVDQDAPRSELGTRWNDPEYRARYCGLK